MGLIAWSPAWTAKVRNMLIQKLQSMDQDKQDFEKAMVSLSAEGLGLAEVLPSGLKTEETMASPHEQDQAPTVQCQARHGSAKPARVRCIQDLM